MIRYMVSEGFIFRIDTVTNHVWKCWPGSTDWMFIKEY